MWDGPGIGLGGFGVVLGDFGGGFGVIGVVLGVVPGVVLGWFWGWFWGGFGVVLGWFWGCGAYFFEVRPRDLRFYKSPEQGLNLSES